MTARPSSPSPGPLKYRVDNIPFYLKPFFYLYSYTIAIISYLLLVITRFTCTIKYEGKEHPEGKNNIYAIWHENLVPYFVVYTRYKEPYAWMNHPLWFMKPVHLILKFMGLKKLFLGSTGHGGKDAMLQVVDHLKSGYNTLIACDGPVGPYKDLKYGVLEMSKLSEVSIIPIQFHLSSSIRLSGWDKKKIPLPFCTITVSYQEPVIVAKDNYEEAKAQIARKMDD